jgi:hypothetical protein
MQANDVEGIIEQAEGINARDNTKETIPNSSAGLDFSNPHGNNHEDS